MEDTGHRKRVLSYRYRVLHFGFRQPVASSDSSPSSNSSLLFNSARFPLRSFLPEFPRKQNSIKIRCTVSILRLIQSLGSTQSLSFY